MRAGTESALPVNPDASRASPVLDDGNLPCGFCRGAGRADSDDDALVTDGFPDDDDGT